MTIKQALKYKNKLVKKISDEFAKVSGYNSVEELSKRPYDVNVAYETYRQMVQELVELKTKIHKANQPVYDKIFLLSELKSMVVTLKALDCSEGKASSKWGRSLGEEPTMKTSVISIVQRDNEVEKLEQEIDNIQELLDTHNATTEI